MISRRHGAIAHEVHGPDDGVAARCAVGRGYSSEGITLDEVNRVEHHHPPRILRPQRIHHGGYPGQASVERPVGDVVPSIGAAMDIGGRSQDEMNGVGRSRCKRSKQQQAGEHGAKI